mgnify:CR=1 FL=1
MSIEQYNGKMVESAYGPLKSRADAWIQTTEPPETFISADVPDCAYGRFRKLIETGAVQKVEKVSHEVYDPDYECEGSSLIWTYRWNTRAWEVIEETVETRFSPCPCNHGGFQNHGDYYTCSYDGCDQRFDRDQLEDDS